MSLSYLSVCSGIEAATMAWHPLGWKPVAFSQFDPDHKGKGLDFASAVLNFHYPDVPNLGDMTKYRDWPDANVDVLVGGTPCQSFSVAGLRAGLDDERGNLMLVYGAIARRYRPRWLAWENVPGVLSDDGGRSFAGLLETGGVPQRFYLSALACQGILRRAEKRGKSLPVPLERALRGVAESKARPTQSA